MSLEEGVKKIEKAELILKIAKDVYLRFARSQKGKVVKRYKAHQTSKMLFGFGKMPAYNTHMEYLVELENGQRVWMNEKQVKQLKPIE